MTLLFPLPIGFVPRSLCNCCPSALFTCVHSVPRRSAASGRSLAAGRVTACLPHQRKPCGAWRWVRVPPARSVWPCFSLWRVTRVHQPLLRALVHPGGGALLTQRGCQGLDSLQALLSQLQHFWGVGAEPFAILCDMGVSSCAPMCGVGGRTARGRTAGGRLPVSAASSCRACEMRVMLFRYST